MRKFFITYGDEKFDAAKKRIISQAKAIGFFDCVISYGRDDLSKELLQSEVFSVQRGGGLWSWKPDVILNTIKKAEVGDIIIYCDSGCSIQQSSEWVSYWNLLERYDMIAQRLFMRTDKWTRKEMIDFFYNNGEGWMKCYQYLATVIIIKVTDFTRLFIEEWRNIVIMHPELVMDVDKSDIKHQKKCFIENRHDQAVYSALIYKYEHNEEFKHHICSRWEHVEDYDLFRRQAIRATRLRQGVNENRSLRFKRCFKRIIKDYLLTPFFYSPLQRYYSHK